MATEQEILDELETAIQNTNRSNDDLLRVFENDEETYVTLRDGEVVPSLDKRVDIKVKAIGEDYLQQLDEVIIDLENKSTVELQKLEDAINTIVVDNGVPDSVVVTWSGRTQEEKNKDSIHASDLGLVANNMNFDNADTLEAALQTLNGKDLILESGATYYTSREVVTVGLDVSIRSNGKPATIKNLSKNIRAMTVLGTEVGIYSVTNSVTIFSRVLTLSDASNVQVGDLIGLVSNKFWYCDARDETYKSQLNKVERIEGNNVFVITAWSESYDTASETLSAYVYRPVQALIRDVDFHCTPMDVSPTASPNVRGLSLRYTTDSVLTNVSTHYAQACGIQVARSFNTLVVGGVSDKSNGYTSGYGVQTDGTSHTRVTKRTVTGSRRGVDVSGIGIISSHTTVDDCTIIGGGVNSRGDTYGWNADGSTGAYQGGIGTHGAANFTEIKDNYIVNVHQPVILRSPNNVVSGNTIIGRTVNGAINVAFGGGNIIEGNSVLQGIVAGLGQSTAVFDGQANINSRRAESLVTLQETCIGEQIIRNNYAEVQSVAVLAMGETANTNTIQIHGNTVVHKTTLGGQECFLINSDTAAAVSMLGSSQIYNNTQRRVGGAGAVLIIPTNWRLLNQPMFGRSEGVFSASTATEVTAHTNTTTRSLGALQTCKVGSLVNASIVVVCIPASTGLVTVDFSVPYVGSFSSNGWCVGTAVSENASAFGVVQSVPNSSTVRLTFNATNTGVHRMQLNFQYQVRN